MKPKKAHRHLDRREHQQHNGCPASVNAAPISGLPNKINEKVPSNASIYLPQRHALLVQRVSLPRPEETF